MNKYTEYMEKLLELKDITLLPGVMKSKWRRDRVNYLISSEATAGEHLPIFTSPMDPVCRISNWRLWKDAGLRPILPRTESLQTRLEAAAYDFVAFGLAEVRDCFITDQARAASGIVWKICLDAGNGNDASQIGLGRTLKKIYGSQVVLMGGNLSEPETYQDYAEAGFDYVRVGCSAGSVVDRGKFGFHYPLASLIEKTRSEQLRWGEDGPKIIADGGITGYPEIMKAIAVGADYVMLGRQLARIIEAGGEIYKRTPAHGKDLFEPITNPEKLYGMPSSQVIGLDLVRYYTGNTSLHAQAARAGYQDVASWLKSGITPRPTDSIESWVPVVMSLPEWISGLRECINYGFSATGSLGWQEYKESVRYARI